MQGRELMQASLTPQRSVHLYQIGSGEPRRKDKTLSSPKLLSQADAMGATLTLTVGTNFLLPVPALAEYHRVPYYPSK